MFKTMFEYLLSRVDDSERDKIVKGEKTNVFEELFRYSGLTQDPWNDSIFRNAIIDGCSVQIKDNDDYAPEYASKYFGRAYERLNTLFDKEFIL